MKKCLVVLFIIGIVFALFAVGCEESPVTDEEVDDAEPVGVQDIRIPGSVLGGVFYVQSSTLAGYINNRMEDIRATVEVTSGGHENVSIVNAADNAMGIGNAMAVWDAWHGDDPFGEEHEDLRAVVWSNPNQTQIVVRDDADINSIEDLEGKVVNPGTRGSGTDMAFNRLLKALGMSYDDFSRVEYITFAEAGDGLRDGVIDAIVWVGGYPASTIEELAVTIGIKLVPFSEEEITTVVEQEPSFFADVVPAGVYEGITEDVPLPSLGSIWLSNVNVPDETVYEVAKLIDENREDLISGHIAFETWRFSRDVENVIPLHPGAVMYYDDAGY